MSKSSEATKKWRKITKQRVVDSLGGGCCICGYNYCLNALEMHHLDPKEKEVTLGYIMANPIAWSRIVKELRKCVLLCSNHHKEVHNGITTIPINAPRFNEEYATKNFRRESWHDCPICGASIPPYRKTCSKSCAAKKARMVKWDNLIVEDMMTKGKSFEEIADFFDVTNMAVQKRIKKIQKSKITLICPCCEREFDYKHGNKKYCSKKCARMASRKVKRPSKEQLIEELKNTSWLALGRKYGVSDNAVRKWAKSYDLI